MAKRSPMPARPDEPTPQSAAPLQRRQVLRCALGLVGGPWLTMTSPPAGADSTGPQLASYYTRHMALVGGVAYGWQGRGPPQRMLAGVRQVGVSQDAFFALHDDGRLMRWTDAPQAAQVLMTNVAAFASGQSGWFAIDPAQVLWQGGGALAAPRRVDEPVVAACIGDSANYYIRRDGSLWVQGLAHRGQYGDGRLTASAGFVQTASGAVAVKAHTGHALYLGADGVVMGTGGNRYGPLGAHGLGDKADRWGPVFRGASAIATGSRHSLALRADGSLWAWGEGFAIEPRTLATGVVAAAAGDTATLAMHADGSLQQWEGGSGPQRLALP